MSEDTIYRQAAIDALDEYIEEYSFDLDENGYHSPKWCAMQEAKMTIQRLPSAVRTGRDLYDTPTLFWCSECGWSTVDTYPADRFNYCPMCGAKMK